MAEITRTSGPWVGPIFEMDSHGAVYVAFSDAPVARTRSLSDLIAVDLDEHGELIGVDFAAPLEAVAVEDMDRLVTLYPDLKEYLLI